MKAQYLLILLALTASTVWAKDFPCNAALLANNDLEPSDLEDCLVREGRIVIIKDGKYGFTDSEGTIVIEPTFDEAWSFQEGLALVYTDEKWGYIKPDGAYVVKPQYSDAWGFSEGLGKVKKNGKVGFINQQGKMVIPLKYDDSHNWFNEGHMAVALNGKWGMIDKKGKMIVKPSYDYIGVMYEGRVVAEKDVDKDGEPDYGYLDNAGKVAIDFVYDEAASFDGGVAYVYKDDEPFWINRFGEPVDKKPDYSNF